MRLIMAFTAVFVFTACTVTETQAAYVGSDNAAAVAYDDGWTSGDDGTSGGHVDAFGQWFLSSEGIFSIGDSQDVGGGGGADINSSGESFRIQAPDGVFAEAFRFIDPAGLSPGQSFSLDMAVNFRGGFKGIDLRGSSDEKLLNFNVGGDDYVVSDAASGNGSLGDTYSSNTAFNILFTQTSVSGGTWTITRSGGLADIDSGTYSGVARSIKLYSGGQGSLQEDDLYVNNLNTTPEPASLALLAMGACFCLRRRR